MKELIIIPPVKESKRGKYLRRITSKDVSKRYSNKEYILSLFNDEYEGYWNKRYSWYCVKHDTFFEDFINNIYRRRSPHCKKCLYEVSVLKCKKFIDRTIKKTGYLLIATRWLGSYKKYIFYCMKCNKLCVCTYHDIVNKKQELPCCYSLRVYDWKLKQDINDIIAKYLTYRMEE